VTSQAIASDDLVISRALVTGRGAGKVDLGRSLWGLHVADVTVGDEILLIPQMRCRTRLSTMMPASHFALGLTEELMHIRRDAMVDPVSGVPGTRAFRFTSHDRYAAWLVQSWLSPASARTREILDDLLCGQSVEQWQRRNILTDGLRIVRLVRTLAAQGSVIVWMARLSLADCTTAVRSLGQTYGFRPAPPAPVHAGERFFEASRMPPTTAAQFHPAVCPVSALEPVPVALEDNVRRLLQSLGGDRSGSFSDLHADVQVLLLTALVLAENPNHGPSLDSKSWSLFLAQQPAVPAASSHADPVTGARSEQKLPVMAKVTDGKNFPRANVPTGPRLSRSKTPRPNESQAPEPVIAIEQSATPQSADRLASSTPVQGLAYATSRRVRSEFGGLMFVINILLTLKLYPDFTMQPGKRLDPSPVWLLAQLGVAFFGRAFRKDPLYRLLLHFGRPGRLPVRWQVDPEWLAGLPRRTVGIRQFDAAAKPWSRAEICASAIRRRRAVGRQQTNRNDHWIASLAKFIGFRIAHAAPGLGVKMLRIPASVEFGDDSIDVHFSLAQLPLAARMAGLDRDPGWLPPEGRSISFHFS
jgi:hypothetical protein